MENITKLTTDFSQKIEDERQKHRIIPTMNQMGYMTETLDCYSRFFMDYIADKNFRVLDIGVAYGATTKEILKRGAHVIANDISPQHLDVLKDNISPSQATRLELLPGRFPQDVNIASESLDAVLASRCFHFLTGYEIDFGLKKIFSFLKPKGKVFITAETVYKAIFNKLIPLYEKRKQSNVRWPGEFEQLHFYISKRKQFLPNYINLLDEDCLKRSLTEAGFIVEKCTRFTKEKMPEDCQLNGKETVGIIGVKPGP